MAEADTAIHRPVSRHPVLFAMLGLVLVVSPWPLGSNRDWAWPVLTIACCLLALTLLFTEKRIELRRYETVTCSAFLLLCLWMLWQLTGIPGLIDPPTLDQFSTESDLLKTIGYACFFFAVVQLLDTYRRVETLLYLVVIMGMLEALLGSAQQLIFELPRARGSFPNPNHYAGYLEITLSLGIGLIIALQGSRRTSSHGLIELITGPRGRLRLIIVIMVVGLVMSRSRLGNMGFLTAILITTGVAFLYSRKISWKSVALLASIFVLDVVIIGSYFGLDRLGERLQQVPDHVARRIDLQSYNARLLNDNLWTGTGAGTYEVAMAQYRDRHFTKRPEHAESDYFEFLIELGVIGTLPLIVILVTGVLAQVKLMHQNSTQFARGISFGCMMGTICLLIHGSLDVNLQIPSNAMLFILLLALPQAILRIDSESLKNPIA